MKKITLADLAYLARELDNWSTEWTKQNPDAPAQYVAWSNTIHRTANELYRAANERGGDPQGKRTRHSFAMDILHFDGSEPDSTVLQRFRDLPPWEPVLAK